jgi:hypothetical protein
MAGVQTEAAEYAEFEREYRSALAEGFAPIGERVGGNIRGAAGVASERLGLTRTQRAHRINWLKQQEAHKPAQIERPALPSPHMGVEDILAHREREFDRKATAAAAAKWMRYTVKQPGPFGLAFVGDPHVDDDGCDVRALRRDLKLIEETPGLYGVGMGDWINNWQRKLGHLYGQQGTSASEAWLMCEWILSRPIWLLLLKGNHDLWSGSGSPLKWMFTHGAPVVDWSAQFVVASGKTEWRIEAAHNFPGASMYNKAHGPKKRALFTAGRSHLYIAADHHNWSLQDDEDEHSGRQYWTCRVRGYKVLDSYADVLGFGQHQHGHSMVAVCDPEDGTMQCFSSLAHGARYLTLLRESRAKKG